MYNFVIQKILIRAALKRRHNSSIQSCCVMEERAITTGRGEETPAEQQQAPVGGLATQSGWSWWSSTFQPIRKQDWIHVERDRSWCSAILLKNEPKNGLLGSLQKSFLLYLSQQLFQTQQQNDPHYSEIDFICEFNKNDVFFHFRASGYWEEGKRVDSSAAVKQQGHSISCETHAGSDIDRRSKQKAATSDMVS